MCNHLVYTYSECGHTHSDGYRLCEAAVTRGSRCERDTWGSIHDGTRPGTCEACLLATPPDSDQ